MTVYTQDEVAAKLLQEIRRRNITQVAFAHSLGISKTHFNNVVCGIKRPGPRILAGIGLKRATLYTEA